MDDKQEMLDLVSIVVPTYNREDFIVEAIESVLSQTYENWELMLVDDGSTDNTQTVIKPYLKDSRIRYFYQENQGQSVARNFGIKNSTGRYICFLDSDNRWLPEKLEVSVQAARENPEVDIIYGDNIIIDINGDEIGRDTMERFSGRVTDQLIKDNFISMNTTMTKRECFETLGGMNEKDRLAEDYELWLRMSTRYSFLYVPKFMGCYRVMEEQLSTDKDKRFWANEKIIRQFRAQYPEAVSQAQWRRGFSAFFVRKARYELSEHRLNTTLKDVLIAIGFQPFWQGPWRVLAKMLLGK